MMKSVKYTVAALMFLMTMMPFLGYSSTVIVTYQTGEGKERLDRVRFLLTNKKQQQEMYPKGKSYVDDEVNPTRMVLIEDLPPGEYTIEFLVPNKDGYFEEVPIRHFTLEKESVVKIDQTINKREI